MYPDARCSFGCQLGYLGGGNLACDLWGWNHDAGVCLCSSLFLLLFVVVVDRDVVISSVWLAIQFVMFAIVSAICASCPLSLCCHVCWSWVVTWSVRCFFVCFSFPLSSVCVVFYAEYWSPFLFLELCFPCMYFFFSLPPAVSLAPPGQPQFVSASSTVTARTLTYSFTATSSVTRYDLWIYDINGQYNTPWETFVDNSSVVTRNISASPLDTSHLLPGFGYLLIVSGCNGSYCLSSPQSAPMIMPGSFAHLFSWFLWSDGRVD